MNGFCGLLCPGGSSGLVGRLPFRSDFVILTLPSYLFQPVSLCVSVYP